VAQVLDTIGRVIARYLERPVQGYEPFASSDPAALRKSLEPGDVLLVEGNSHISGVIKYLTQSTWSHAALCVGPIEGTNTHEGEPHVLVEAEIGEGVVSSPLSKYYSYHTRICRPIGLSAEDRATVCGYAIDRIGFDYDLRNIIDLMRYLVPLPVPQRWRRRMIALGSGNPTRLICSALIAQAFEAVRYPILPKVTRLESEAARREILEIRHSSLYAPRDFDISPYFTIVKPTLLEGFNYKSVHWADLPAPFPGSRHVWAARGPSFHNLSFCESTHYEQSNGGPHSLWTTRVFGGQDLCRSRASRIRCVQTFPRNGFSISSMPAAASWSRNPRFG
jgi:hypothetical protein